MMLKVRIAQQSAAGGRARNEDCIGSLAQDGKWCLVLSDGAGGHDQGAVASRLVVDCILAGFKARPPVDPADLAELMLDANDAVLAAQRAVGAQVGSSRAMHATVVVLLVDPAVPQAIWGHVGDSRLYVIRNGNVIDITHDDSVVQWMVSAGHLAASEARVHPHKNRLLAAIGTHGTLEPHVVNEPFRLLDGDVFLLCSDGWWDAVSAEEIVQGVATAPDAEGWIAGMAQTVAARAGADHDNYSALGCWIGDPNEVTRIEAQRPRGATSVAR